MKTIFIPVPVSNLPENNSRHFVLTKRQSGNTEVVSEKRASFHGGKWVDDTLFDGEEVTAWLREVEVPEGLPSDEEIDLIEQPHLTPTPLPCSPPKTPTSSTSNGSYRRLTPPWRRRGGR
jgi:hypothetical protein